MFYQFWAHADLTPSAGDKFNVAFEEEQHCTGVKSKMLIQ